MTSQLATVTSLDNHQANLRITSMRCTERKVVSVMFADVQGSMALTRTLELEQWWSLIAGLFEVLCETVYEFGGWVGNFTGDGIEAVFDGTGTDSDHAERACDAALRMREAIRGPAAELFTAHGLELSVRIGINSGEVIAGTIGGRYKRYYTANGYAVALAKRVEALACPDRTYLTEYTAALVADRVALRDLGRFEMKGAIEPVGIFELQGNHPQPHRSPVAIDTQEDRTCSIHITTSAPHSR